MKTTTYEGVVEDGYVRLPANVSLPENTKVYVVVPDPEAMPMANIGSPRLVHPDQARDFEKQVVPE